jgi:hypothetical protein
MHDHPTAFPDPGGAHPLPARLLGYRLAGRQSIGSLTLTRHTLVDSHLAGGAPFFGHYSPQADSTLAYSFVDR